MIICNVGTFLKIHFLRLIKKRVLMKKVQIEKKEKKKTYKFRVSHSTGRNEHRVPTFACLVIRLVLLAKWTPEIHGVDGTS